MTIAYRAGTYSYGEAKTATIDVSGLGIVSGDLVIFYVNRNDSIAITVDSDAGAAWETALFAETPSGETAYHACFWKEANGFEPNDYTADLDQAEADAHYTCIVKVFSGGGTGWEVDTAAVTAVNASNATNLECVASNGKSVSANSVSIVTGGKDRNDINRLYTAVDNSFVSPLGRTLGRFTGMAHRLFTTSSSDVGTTEISTTEGTCTSDKVYSSHFSFIESAAGGSIIPQIMHHRRQMG